jgi:hypothetical protein
MIKEFFPREHPTCPETEERTVMRLLVSGFSAGESGCLPCFPVRVQNSRPFGVAKHREMCGQCQNWATQRAEIGDGRSVLF